MADPVTGDTIPEDVKALVQEFIQRPKTRADIAHAAVTFRLFWERLKQAGTLVALAEIDDRDMRISLAKAIQKNFPTAATQDSQAP